MDNKVTYWIEMSDYDLETANAMLLTGRYLYVGFMCHQTMEKILKAYWTNCLTEIPLKTHALSRLAERTGLKSLTKEYCTRILEQTKELQLWIKNKL